MKRAAFAFALLLMATSARSDGLGNYGLIGQPDSGGIGGSLAALAPPPPCTPGTNNGQLDFSVCSNIAYVPALIH